MRYGILLFGPPGAGKDTQGELLAAALGIPHVSAGELCRNEVASGSEFGKYIEPYLLAGKVIPGAAPVLVREVMVQRGVADSGYVMNGFPRVPELLDDFLTWGRPTHVFYLVVPDDEVRVRLACRGRHDDDGDALEKRIAHYRSSQIPLLAAMRAQGTLSVVEIDGTQSVGDVTRAILDSLK